jgi:hypothetical protein
MQPEGMQKEVFVVKKCYKNGNSVVWAHGKICTEYRRQAKEYHLVLS